MSLKPQSQDDSSMAAEIQALSNEMTVDADFVEEQEQAPEDAQNVDTDSSSTTEQTLPEESQESEQGSTLTDEATRLIHDISSESEEEREVRIKKLEKSGRKEHLEAAKVLREMYGGKEEEKITEEAIASAVTRKLEELGLNPEKLKEVQIDREKQERETIASKVIADLGVKLDARSAVNNVDFIKEFYKSEYNGLSLADKTRLALTKTIKAIVPDKSKTGGVVKPQVQVPTGMKKIDEMSAQDIYSFLRTATVADLSKTKL